MGMYKIGSGVSGFGVKFKVQVFFQGRCRGLLAGYIELQKVAKIRWFMMIIELSFPEIPLDFGSLYAREAHSTVGTSNLHDSMRTVYVRNDGLPA